tara:strand:- start:58 stop:291 length:234 start_codon:yes stop_codon:yes gene_type:complete
VVVVVVALVENAWVAGTLVDQVEAAFVALVGNAWATVVRVVPIVVQAIVAVVGGVVVVEEAVVPQSVVEQMFAELVC